ncbi:glycosyltransferase [Rhodopirellula europaea]|uniref:Glycosyltransferase n=1 Tax=Rhodopirellula europaea SH398 TaxID=1263868 RepID=M5RZI3_9BACT|nr:glycosyltransferase family A protein [Rhodopirellula europaea]EMI24768.1 glycosyltransferase [Rhodopirellula europaea SH398]
MQVSIIITCYDRERWVARAIRSAVAQKFPKDEFEVIVVDDGSTDHSREIIDNFSDDIVRIYHDENRGLPAARNSGIKRSKGRYVMHLDSDDYISEDTIRLLSLFLNENHDWGAVGCDYKEVNESETLMIRRYANLEPIACGLMFRTDALIAIGLYNEEMRVCEDEELRERFEEKYIVGHCRLPLYRYMRHEENITNDKESVEKYRAKLRKSAK